MGNKTSTVTEKADPWGPSQPYLLDSMKQAQNLYRNQNMVAPENPTLMSGYGNMLKTAQGFDPSLTRSGMEQMQSTINGDYMDGNPYLDEMYGRAADKVQERIGDSVTSMFSKAGRYGSGAHQKVMGDSVGDALGSMAANMYGDAYQTERQNQLNAAQAAPGMNNAYQGMLFNNANAILGVGRSMQDHDQARYMAPYDALNHYSGIVHGYGGLGGTGSQTTPGGSRLGGAIGGGLAGAAAGAAAGGQSGLVFGLPGAAVGAGIGAIGGLF